MKFLPGSLAARTVLLVIAAVLVAEITTFSLILNQGRTAHKLQTVNYVAGQIRLLQTVLPGLDNEVRRRLSEADIGEHGVQLRPDGESVPQHQPEFPFARTLARDLKHHLGEQVILRHAGPGQQNNLWIGFIAGGERWWLLLPPPRFAPKALPHDLWLWLASALAVLVVIAGLFVRGIVRPLARLGEAVTATGDGSACAVTPEGPQEVRRLAERHNTMLGQLAAANTERREMLAGLTHDLRAPLARLRVRLALLDNDNERAGLARDAEDMERIIGQCLAFLRTEDDGARCDAPLLMADALSDSVARQRELGCPVSLTVSDAAAHVQVAISHGSLQRLIDNLIDNALQHGAAPVEVSLCIERPAMLTLRVRDHGRGIPAELYDHALEAFSQIDPARATGGSCGLGLAIVRRIVGGCGGELKLAEAAGGGLDVILNFPALSDGDRNLV